MHCTIVICTRDRARPLNDCLTAIASLAAPAHCTWDVLVVDNGSRDHTAEIVASFEPRLDIRRIVEPRAGLSNARNAGVAHAKGDYLLWTDDDVIVEPTWLAAYASAFAAYPDAAVFGGRITPVLEAPTPDWFVAAQEDLRFLLAARDFGSADRSLSLEDDCIPYGANYAVRADVQRAYPYDPMLGVAPGRRRGGEETAVIKAILSDGSAGFWVADAAVRHCIPSSRQSLSYVKQFYYAMGEAWAYSELRRAGRRRLPLQSVAKASVGFVRLRCAELLGLEGRIRFQASFSYHRGVIASMLRGNGLDGCRLEPTASV